MGWEKINARKDVSNPSWFKFKHSFFEDPDFYDFSRGEILAWVYMLCCASKKSSATVFITFEHAERIGRVTKDEILSSIKKLVSKQIVHANVTPTGADVTDAGARIDKNREEKRREEENRQHSLVFDFESVYRRYPRKIGKTKGFKKLKTDIRTQEDFERLIVAVENYAVSRRDQDSQYTKHFSTFVGEWRDWLTFVPSDNPAPTPNNPAYRRMAGNQHALNEALKAIGEDGDEQAS